MKLLVSRLASCAAVLTAATFQARAIDLSQRSQSLSKQFIVYSDDRGLRLAIAGASEEAKKGVLSILGLSRDGWKYPIVISAQRASATGPTPAPSSVQLFETDDGFKVEFDLCVNADPADVQFQQQLVRAILLELAYRDTRAIKSGVAYTEPPMWLIEGIVALLQSRESGANMDVFKTLVSANRLPSLKTFLEQSTSGLDSTSRAIYSACAMSLVQMLLELPDGRPGLALYVRNLATASHDTSTDLLKYFPALGGSSQSLEKWWSLNMARFSAADRYAGLSLEESEQRTAALLTFQLPVDKKGGMKTFTIGQFKEYLKIRESRQVLMQISTGFLALQTNANALFRPVVFEYRKSRSTLPEASPVASRPVSPTSRNTGSRFRPA